MMGFHQNARLPSKSCSDTNSFFSRDLPLPTKQQGSACPIKKFNKISSQNYYDRIARFTANSCSDTNNNNNKTTTGWVLTNNLCRKHCFTELE